MHLRIWLFRASFLVAALPILPLAGELAESSLGSLPPVGRAAWVDYIGRSKAAAGRNEAAVRDEVASAGLEKPLAAPSGGDFKVRRKPGDPYFGTDEAAELADVLISWQTPAGGWSKHCGYSRGARKPGMLWSSQYKPGHRPHYLGTIDNHATTAEITFLANVWHETRRPDCKQAVELGLEYLLQAQYPNGGWPQVYPIEGGYHDAITLNDDAMTHVLELLKRVADEEPEMACVDPGLRKRCAEAFQRGIGCVVKMQVVLDGKPTVWCAQHDPVSLEPVAARAMEPASLSSVESANLLKFLMTLRDPGPELVACIEGGLAWLDQAAGPKVREEKRDGTRTYVPDDAGERRWARFYDLETGRAIFPGRDRVIYDSFDELAKHNEVGYDYYSNRPGSVVTNGRKKWLKLRSK